MLKTKISAAIIGMSIIGGGLLTTMAATDSVAGVSTEASTTKEEKMLHNNRSKLSEGRHGGRGGKRHEGRHEGKAKVEAAIMAGDYAAFKLVASTTPLANISQDVFISLKAPMTAQKQAEDSISAILKAAGVTERNEIRD